MKTKNCPFCSKEISDEAIICKYCHRLLIDENGNDILPEEEEEEIFDETEQAEEPAFDEEKTIIYNKEDFENLLNKKNAPAEEEPVAEEDTEDGEEEFDASAVIGGAEGPELDSYPDDGDDYEEYNEEPEQPVYRGSSNEEYDDGELADAADYDPKRTFMITAIVTLGILLIIIVAVLVGYKLFGFGDGEDTTTSQAELSTSAAAEPAPAADTASAAGTGDSAEFVPQITDDTVSENPEEIANSSLSDPVADPNATVVPPVVDSEAATPETVVPDSTASTDSVSNIVILPDPDAVSSSQASDESSTDSAADSTADSVGDGSAADSSTADSSSSAPAGEGAPGFDAQGSYYSWGEAEQLIANYAAANNLGTNYSYYNGTDGVEMIYAFYDDYGNATLYRVDLQTGYVSAY